jgi:hypothetical protein
MKQAAHPIEQEELMAYLDGELDPERASNIAAHVAQCTDCLALSADLRRVSQHLTAWEAEPAPTKMDETVLQAMKETRSEARLPQTHVVEALLRSFRKRPVRYALAGTTLFVAGVIFATVFIPVMYEKSGTREPLLLAELKPGMTSPSNSRQAGSGTLGRLEANVASEGNAKDENGQPIPQNGRQAVAGDVLGRIPGGPELGSVSVPAGPMIVQTASLSVETQNYDESRAAVERIVAQHNGYVEKLSARALAEVSRETDASLRIPSDQLEGALADFRKLGHVAQESRSNEDVSSQYVDVSARLKSARTTEQRLLELLAGHTGKLQDVLAVEQELQRVRGDIESMEGQRALLEHRVRYSAVELSLREEYRERLGGRSNSTGIKLRNALVEGYRNVTDGVLAVALFLLSYGPALLLCFAALFFPARFAWRRWRPASLQGSSLGVK